MNKKTLGQFYTENYKYIFTGLHIPSDIKNVIEPFVGKGDLLDFIHNNVNIECYDIDPKISFAAKKDTILDPPEYIDKFIITNPPYLARNKSKDKKVFDFYKLNDLYKCFLQSILNETNLCLGGILIIPLNFWCSIRKSDIDLRKEFLKKYNIVKLNIFEESVFKDTTYTVCSFQFEKRKEQTETYTIPITCFPWKKSFSICLNKRNNFIIGGEIYKLPQSEYKISRSTKNNFQNETSLILKCIDDSSNSKISLTFNKENRKKYRDCTPKLSNRTYAIITIFPPISEDKEKELEIKFNNFLNLKRQEYNSLFLTNYRESKDISRKRISFDLAYKIINYLLL